MLDLKIGDVVLVTKLTALASSETSDFSATFTAPKGKAFVAFVIGTTNRDTKISQPMVDNRLREFGYVPSEEFEALQKELNDLRKTTAAA